MNSSDWTAHEIECEKCGLMKIYDGNGKELSEINAMTIHPEFITEGDEDELRCHIEIALGSVREKKRNGRNRVWRAGWDYDTDKWIGAIPQWLISDTIIVDGFDSVTINEYLRGQSIAPHMDSLKFGDVGILSLLADATMRFTSAIGEQRDFVLPRRSLAIMSGELRYKWKHETLPLEADLRHSIVYRKRIS